MKQLVSHLVSNNLDEIVEKSFLNCHTLGLHSIMLISSPEKTVRLFIAMPGNGLYRNQQDLFYSADMSIAFHPHHCNVTLHCIKGTLVNWMVEETTEDNGHFDVEKFLYQSAIKQNETKFVSKGMAFLKPVRTDILREGESVSMKADEIHTVSCSRSEVTAWFVYEGKENSSYTPYCWSNYDLSKEDFSHLYKKPDKGDIIRLLHIAELL